MKLFINAGAVMKAKILGLLVSCLLATGTAGAIPATYYYAGNQFFGFLGDPGFYSNTDLVTGSVTFAQPLVSNTTYQASSPLAWSISDSHGTLNNINALLQRSDFVTGADGIEDWNFAAAGIDFSQYYSLQIGTAHNFFSDSLDWSTGTLYRSATSKWLRHR